MQVYTSIVHTCTTVGELSIGITCKTFLFICRYPLFTWNLRVWGNEFVDASLIHETKLEKTWKY